MKELAHDPRHSRLDDVDAATLHTIFDGVMRDFHNKVYDLRAAFDKLPASDEREAGLAVTQLVDQTFHFMQKQISLLATVAVAQSVKEPLILQEALGGIEGLTFKGEESLIREFERGGYQTND